HGHDDFGGRAVFFLVDIDRDAAAVVRHRDRPVLVDGHHHLVGVLGQGLVDRVVDHLEHHVVQAGAVVHVADVHAGPLAHGFETAQHGDPGRIVGLDGFTRRDLGFFGHSHTTVAARRGNGSDATTLKLLERKRELYRAGRPGWVGDGAALQLRVAPEGSAERTTPCSTWNTVIGH